VLAGLVLAASIGLLLMDVARADQQRIGDMYRDLAATSLIVGEDTLAPQIALNEFTADWDTILATINGRSEHFARSFERFRELFPQVRALQAASSPEITVALVGDPGLKAAFGAADALPFCAGAKGYSVVASGVGSRGWIALAIDPQPTLERARAAAGQPVRVALVQAGSADVLAADRGPGCGPMTDPTYRAAASGGYGVDLVPRATGTAAIGYTAVVGTSLRVVVEDDPSYREAAAWERRARIAGVATLLLVGGHVVWRLRRLRPSGA